MDITKYWRKNPHLSLTELREQFGFSKNKKKARKGLSKSNAFRAFKNAKRNRKHAKAMKVGA